MGKPGGCCRLRPRGPAEDAPRGLGAYLSVRDQVQLVVRSIAPEDIRDSNGVPSGSSTASAATPTTSGVWPTPNRRLWYTCQHQFRRCIEELLVLNLKDFFSRLHLDRWGMRVFCRDSDQRIDISDATVNTAY